MASSSNTKWSYDVFLSFRGTDVRKEFIDHLYAAFTRDGIHSFLDQDKIEFGQNIGPACLGGIQDSRFALLILSKRYAFSPWCLEELHHILLYKHSDDILPVFYGDINQSHLRNLSGSFGEAFLEHEKRFDQHLLIMWKQDLQKVSYLKSLIFPDYFDKHEAKNIDHIVKEISKRLNRTSLSFPTPPVGLNSPVSEVVSLIADELDDFRIIGIYGMVGIGKTTIAKEVFNKLSLKFETTCFLKNVRQLSISKSVAYLQRQLLTATLKRKHEKVTNVDAGLTMIIERLRHRRLLLVLDDVDNLVQVNKIVGKRDWFFPGSRLIITTIIRDFLQPPEYWQYEVKELGYDNSLQLLNLHAFDKIPPSENYRSCAEKIIGHAGGNPLALEVLGSSLCGQSFDAWNSRLEKLKKMSDGDIYSRLKLCYDSLDDTEKFIFLDIACFFIGYDKDYVTSILDGCRFFAVDGINTLIRRCLMKVSSDNKLVMHDLIRDMGRHIVQHQHLTDPGERSRLWLHEDVIDVLNEKRGTKAIEGLVLNMPGSELSWSTKAFKKMKMLRLLQLNHVRVTGSFEYISSKLRWLCWHGFPLEFIPFDLDLEYLVALDMRHSNLITFSEQGKSLRKLKFLNLSHTHGLLETPDFEDCPKLEKLIAKDCTKLERVHNSIGRLSNLVLLNMRDCKNLKDLPASIGDLISLENLNLSGCSKLEELPVSIGLLSRLIHLNLQDCENLKTLPESIGDMKALEELNVSGCSGFEELPECIGLGACKKVKHLPRSTGDVNKNH